MPHSPELVERMLKEAGFFDNVKSWFSGFLASKPPATKEKKRALTRADAHFKAKDKDWDSFVDNASRKSFAKAVSNDGRADAKLKMHVDNINRLKTGKVLGTIKGTEGSRTARRDGSQSYKIIKLRGSDRLGCTCRDWRFKKSVAQPGEQVDCKHIRQFKQMNKTATYEEGGSFTHDGQKYSLREAFRTARTKPTKQIDVDKLKWILRHDRPDPKRLAAANLAAPVIVAPDRRGRPTVVDGLHRLSKAVQQGKKTVPAKMLTLSDLKKEAGHVEDRIAERAPGATYEVAKIRARIPMMNLRKGQTYHVPLKGGKGYAVIGDVGRKHVVKTVLGPNMRPPGQRLALR